MDEWRVHSAEGIITLILKLRQLRLEYGAAYAEQAGTSVNVDHIFVCMLLRIINLLSLSKTQKG